jgi:hypothetical protein
VRDPTTLRRRAMAQLLTTFANLRDGHLISNLIHPPVVGEPQVEQADGQEAEAGEEAEEGDVPELYDSDGGEMETDLDMIVETVSEMLERRAGQGVSLHSSHLRLPCSRCPTLNLLCVCGGGGA